MTGTPFGPLPNITNEKKKDIIFFEIPRYYCMYVYLTLKARVAVVSFLSFFCFGHIHFHIEALSQGSGHWPVIYNVAKLKTCIMCNHDGQFECLANHFSQF